MDEITTEAELSALLGEPTPAAAAKERTSLDDIHRAVAGGLPVLPGGDQRRGRLLRRLPQGRPAGLHARPRRHDDRAARARGNRRADGFRNILANPHVGLIHLLPGRGDTLRINGRARLVRDAVLLDRMVVKGHRPLLAMVVEMQQVFFHCAKAFLRSGLWEPGSWTPDVVPSRARIAHQQERADEDLAAIERYYGESYSAGLYPSA